MKTKLLLAVLLFPTRWSGSSIRSVSSIRSGSSIRSTFFFCLFTFIFCLGKAQVPQGFNYQGIARDGSGNVLSNQLLPVKIDIVDALTSGNLIYEELFSSVTSNQFGLISFVVGTGTPQSGGRVTSFSAIDWKSKPLYIRTIIEYPGSTWTTMGTSQIMSVPYTLIAKDVQGPVTSIPSLGITGTTDVMDSALFEVRNKAGNIVFAVYNEGIRAYVGNGSKGAKGGFAVGGYDATKGSGTIYDLFVLNTDSARFYVDSKPNLKGARGGFSVGGYDMTKGTFQDYLDISKDSARIYIDSNPSTKGTKGGFAVGGYDMTKGTNTNYMNVNTDASGIINPSQNRILWYPLKNAFLTGKVLIESPDSVGENSFASGYESKAIGQYSQALGYQAEACGNYSTSIGYQSVANQDNSFAFGQWAMAKNQESYAFGRGAIAEGYRSFAFGSAGVDSAGKATGVAYAMGDYSFAFGQGSQAMGIGSVAIGIADTAKGIYSIALGYQTSSKDYYTTSMGNRTKASGFNATAMGSCTKASGIISTSIGDWTDASGWGSTAIGYFTKASGDRSTSMGIETKASGGGSTAMGVRTVASESGTTAMGMDTFASGVVSTAMGNETTASGSFSTSMGYSTIASGAGSTAFGGLNEAKGIYSTTMGCRTKSSGDKSTAMGYYSNSKGSISTAMGYGTIAKPWASLVIGQFNDSTCSIGGETSWWTSNIDPLFIIGNGTDDGNRHNAFTVLRNSMVGINMVNPQQMLDIAGGNGRVQTGYNWLTNSDVRFKKNISTLEGSLDKILTMRGVSFDLISDSLNVETGKKNIGFIAQELEKVVPEVVVTGTDGYKAVAYDKITAVLTEAIKEQQKQIEGQEKQIESSRLENQQLRSELDELKALVNSLIANQTV